MPIRSVSSVELAARSQATAFAAHPMTPSLLAALGDDANRKPDTRLCARALLGYLYSAVVDREAKSGVERLDERRLGALCDRMGTLGLTHRNAHAVLQTFFGQGRPSRAIIPHPTNSKRRGWQLDDTPEEHTVEVSYGPPVHGLGGWEHLATLRDSHTDMARRLVARDLLGLFAVKHLSMEVHAFVHALDWRGIEQLVADAQPYQHDQVAFCRYMEGRARGPESTCMLKAG